MPRAPVTAAARGGAAPSQASAALRHACRVAAAGADDRAPVRPSKRVCRCRCAPDTIHGAPCRLTFATSRPWWRAVLRSASCFPNQVDAGIDAILAADFLSQEQKADVLCHNAALFLRLAATACTP